MLVPWPFWEHCTQLRDGSLRGGPKPDAWTWVDPFSPKLAHPQSFMDDISDKGGCQLAEGLGGQTSAGWSAGQREDAQLLVQFPMPIARSGRIFTRRCQPGQLQSRALLWFACRGPQILAKKTPGRGPPGWLDQWIPWLHAKGKLYAQRGRGVVWCILHNISSFRGEFRPKNNTNLIPNPFWCVKQILRWMSLFQGF